MGLLQGFDGLVVRLELGELLFVFLDALVEPTFEFLDLAAELSHFRPVLLLYSLFFPEEALLVLLELLQTFSLLLGVVLFEFLDFGLP